MGKITDLSDIFLTPLAQISTEGGYVFHGIKNDEESYCGFGEAYFSSVNAGQIKAWKLHKEMTMNLIVPSGMVKFVFFDIKCESLRTETIGLANYSRITVPPGIWFGFQGLSDSKLNLVLNFANIKHNKDEVMRKDIKDINYEWI